MPYINQTIRDELDPHIGKLIEEISYFDDDKEGVINYVITSIVAGSMKPSTGWRYAYLNRAYGTFFSAAAEFYRRLVAPYEDKCIEKNGDIEEYGQTE